MKYFISNIHFLITVFAAMVVSCNNEVKEYRLGQFVYNDDSEVLHIDENCSNLISGKSFDGHSTYVKIPIDTTRLIKVERVCSKCVSDSIYIHLKRMCFRNKEIDEDRGWLYRKLRRAGYRVGEYETFIQRLADKKVRKRLYSATQQEGLKVGSFEEFSAMLGF